MHRNSVTLLKNGEPAAVAQYNCPSERSTIIKRWKALYGAGRVKEENLVDTILMPKTIAEKKVSVEDRVIPEKSAFKKGNIYKSGKIAKIIKGRSPVMGFYK